MQNSEEAKQRRRQLLQEREKTSFRRYFTSVGCAVAGGLLSVPFVRNKVMMQCRPELLIAGREPLWTSPINTIRHIYNNEGNTKFFRGVIPYMGALIPLAFARQTAANSFSRDLDEKPSGVAQFSRGFATATITSILAIPLTPLTIAATKMMADTKPAKRAIYENHGPLTTLRSVYSMGGFSKLFVGAVPIWAHTMAHFLLLWTFTQAITIPFQHNPIASSYAHVVASALAVIAAHPLDTIRTRMQYRLHTQVTDYIPEYKGMVHCAKDIWRSEGMKGFYRGGSGAIGTWVMVLFASLWASNRSQKLRGSEAKNEAILQRRLTYSDNTNRINRRDSQERNLEDRFYGFDNVDMRQPYKD